MLGWFSAEAARASCSNRASRSEIFDTSSGSTFSATSRPSLESLARYTSPIPPAPSGAITSYGPNRLPAEIINSIQNPKSMEPVDEVEVRRGAGVSVRVGAAVRRDDELVDPADPWIRRPDLLPETSLSGRNIEQEDLRRGFVSPINEQRLSVRGPLGGDVSVLPARNRLRIAA